MRIRRLRVMLAMLSASVVVAVPAAALAIQSHAKAKAHEVKLTLKSSTNSKNPTTVVGDVTGSFKGTFVGKVNPPATDYTLKVKGGSFVIQALFTESGADLKGTWKVADGKGEFKGIKGSGTGTGVLQSPATFQFKGKLTYK